MLSEGFHVEAIVRCICTELDQLEVKYRLEAGSKGSDPHYSMGLNKCTDNFYSYGDR